MEALGRSGTGVLLSVHREIWCPPAGSFLSAYRENDVSAVRPTITDKCPTNDAFGVTR